MSRSTQASASPRTGASAAVASAPANVRGVVMSAALITGLVLWVFWNFLSNQFEYAVRHQADWGHTLVIPFIAGYFVYLNRQRLAAIQFRTTWVGLVPVVVGTAWYSFCWLGPPTLRHHNLQGAGMTMALFGLVLLFVGFRAMALLWFPLLYMCVFGQQISTKLMNYVTFPLQDITARGSYVLLTLLGVDVERAGNFLTVFDDGVEKPLNIAEACSGMRMLMAFLALGTAMAYTGFKTLWQRVAVVLLGIPIAIFVNVLRVVTLALLALFDTNFAAGDFHTFIGLLWLVPAFFMYLGVMWILRHMVIEQPVAAAGAEAAP